MHIFLNNERKLRNIWWVAVFFLVLASLLFPLILLSQRCHFEVAVSYQAVIVVAATWICQLLRKKTLSELTGRFNKDWFLELLKGSAIGAALMLIPATFLLLGGWVSFQSLPVNFSSILSATGLFIAVAIAEEFLFRGFIFQRLNGALGIWLAQLLMAGYFLLIHLNNPGMTGMLKQFASVNIFLASIMFGLAFIKTQKLAIPIGLHFMANWVQGTLLGFGVSGNDEQGILKPIFHDAPLWLTGGSFGLEASLPGLLTVIATIILLYRWHPGETKAN